jgi:hypothetical protein
MNSILHHVALMQLLHLGITTQQAVPAPADPPTSHKAYAYRTLSCTSVPHAQVLALTFDDGPHVKHMNAVLDNLKAEHICADASQPHFNHISPRMTYFLHGTAPST